MFRPLGIWLLLSLLTGPSWATSLRFFGNGVDAPGLDRVEIPLDAPARPIDVGAGDRMALFDRIQRFEQLFTEVHGSENWTSWL